MTQEHTEQTPEQIRAGLIHAYGLTLDAVFIPFSQSRNKAEKHKSLNWQVTLKKSGRVVLTTDYTQGIGHAPGYKNPPKFKSGKYDAWIRDQAASLEAETGLKAEFSISNYVYKGKKPLPAPSTEEVLYSLLMEYSVLDEGTFENWADLLGYDTDSRSAEKIYRECIEIALKLRAGLGETCIRELQDAFQDY